MENSHSGNAQFGFHPFPIAVKSTLNRARCEFKQRGGYVDSDAARSSRAMMTQTSCSGDVSQHRLQTLLAPICCSPLHLSAHTMSHLHVSLCMTCYGLLIDISPSYASTTGILLYSQLLLLELGWYSLRSSRLRRSGSKTS